MKNMKLILSCCVATCMIGIVALIATESEVNAADCACDKPTDWKAGKFDYVVVTCTVSEKNGNITVGSSSLSLPHNPSAPLLNFPQVAAGAGEWNSGLQCIALFTETVEGHVNCEDSPGTNTKCVYVQRNYLKYIDGGCEWINTGMFDGPARLACKEGQLLNDNPAQRVEGANCD